MNYYLIDIYPSPNERRWELYSGLCYEAYLNPDDLMKNLCAEVVIGSIESGGPGFPAKLEVLRYGSYRAPIENPMVDIDEIIIL